MPSYDRADETTQAIVAAVMKKYHPEMHDHGVTVQTLMALPVTNDNGESQGPPLKDRGYPVVAKIRATSLRDRVAGMADIMIEIDDDRWKQFTEAERRALIDHELYHLYIKRDKDEQVVLDDHGRPKFRTRPHDREVSWFDVIARRHGKDSMEYKAWHSLWNHTRQLDLPFMDLNSVG